MLPADLPRLTNPPIVLRAFEPRDRQVVALAGADPLIPLITTVPAGGTTQEQDAYLARQRERLTSGAGYSFAIADVDTDVAVGQIGLWTQDAAAGRATTGYWIAANHRRRGFGRAALQAVTEWALTLHGIHRVQLFVEPWNDGSWRVAEACGYQREGLLRSWVLVGATRKDMLVYSVVLGDVEQDP